MLWVSPLSTKVFVSVSPKRPAKINHHGRTNVSLVPFFESLKSWWNLFACSSLTSPLFLGKNSKWECKKCIVNEIRAPISLWDCSIWSAFCLQLVVLCLSCKFWTINAKAFQASSSLGVNFVLKSPSFSFFFNFSFYEYTLLYLCFNLKRK